MTAGDVGHCVFERVVLALAGQVALTAPRARVVHVVDPEKAALIDEVRHLHEQLGWSYAQLARWYAIPKATVQSWCVYRRC
jgi:DNA-binding transcriptional regulator YiaG